MGPARCPGDQNRRLLFAQDAAKIAECDARNCHQQNKISNKLHAKSQKLHGNHNRVLGAETKLPKDVFFAFFQGVWV